MNNIIDFPKKHTPTQEELIASFDAQEIAIHITKGRNDDIRIEEKEGADALSIFGSVVSYAAKKLSEIGDRDEQANAVTAALVLLMEAAGFPVDELPRRGHFGGQERVEAMPVTMKGCYKRMLKNAQDEQAQELEARTRL